MRGWLPQNLYKVYEVKEKTAWERVTEIKTESWDRQKS